MDTLPLKFVDSVVELFGKETLDQMATEVRHPKWKDVVDLHYRNRVYYEIFFRLTEDGMQHYFQDVNTKRDFLVNTQIAQKDRRFARIYGFKDVTTFSTLSYWEEVEPLGEVETDKLLNNISPLIDQVSGCFHSIWGSTDCAKVLLSSLFKKVYLRQITLTYCGQIAYDFLEDQINNSSFLDYVLISGHDWPQSSLDLLKKFCLRERPGNHVRVYVSGTNVVIDSSHIKHLLDLWKTNGNLNFLFKCVGYRSDKDYEAVMKKYEVLEIRNDSWETFFKHPTAKSIARVSNSKFVMEWFAVECFTCECDRSKKCLLKEQYPQYHNLWP
uniref:F-box domain-containing protein n=1 Tax=Steinernema glaseri TaxID=37863 RepID=A0A1I8AAL0_9BILA